MAAEWFALGIGAIALGGAALRRWYMSDPVRASWAKHDAWVRGRIADGATWDDIHAESNLRYSLAILRDVTTRHVMTAPDGPATYRDCLKQEIAAQAGVLRGLDPSLAKRFIKIVSELRHSDILYPEAYDRVYPMPVIPKLERAQEVELARIRQAAFTDL